MLEQLTIDILEKSGADAETEFIRQSLADFNETQAGGMDCRSLQVILRNDHDEIVGGLLGWTLWSWLHVDSLWVADSMRHRGWGSRILQAAEREARERGCELSDVDTFNFQALAFYEKAGYQRFGTLEGIGKGSMERYYLRKVLRAPNSEPS